MHEFCCGKVVDCDSWYEMLTYTTSIWINLKSCSAATLEGAVSVCTELLAALCVTSHILIIMSVKVGTNYLLSEHQLNYSYLTPGRRYRDCLLVQWFHRELHSPSLGSEQMGLHESGWMKLATAQRKSKPRLHSAILAQKAQHLKQKYLIFHLETW